MNNLLDDRQEKAAYCRGGCEIAAYRLTSGFRYSRWSISIGLRTNQGSTWAAPWRATKEELEVLKLFNQRINSDLFLHELVVGPLYLFDDCFDFVRRKVHLLH